MDWENHLETNQIKNAKIVELNVNRPHMNRKKASKKENFCSNTVSSLYLKILVKLFYATKPLAFLLHFILRRDRKSPFQFELKNYENE